MYTFGGANGSAILGKKKVSLGTSGVTATVRPVHETAHAFCKLDDEYVYSSFRSTKDSPNCFNDLSKIPDAFADYGRPFAGCLNDKSARTSYSSIMGTGTEDEAESRVPLFNVWDCGACLREIYWGEGKIADYAKKCRDKNMDTANPTQKPHPEDYGWNCFSDKDCPGYKNLKWSPDCVSTCVSNKCTVNDGKTCDPKSFKIVEDENGKYQTIYDKPGKCGSKDKGTEGQCVPLPPPECVSDKDCNSSSKTDFQCKNECSSGKCTNTAGTACITEDSSLTLTGKKGKCGSKASGTAGQCVLVKQKST